MTIRLTLTELEQIRELRSSSTVTLTEVDRNRDHLKELDEIWTHIQTRLVAQMPPTGERETRDSYYKTSDLKSDLLFITRGPSAMFGVTDPELAGLPTWLPGKAEVLRLLDKLEMLRQRIVARETEPVWPRRFRYVGRGLKHDHDGRPLSQGEVVMLSETQASAFADRFESV